MKFFRKLFLVPHLASLLISVLAATGMWYVVSVRDRIEAQFEVSIDYFGIPKNLMVTDGLINKLTVRLRGPETLLRSISQQHLNQQVNLSDIKKGVTIVPLAAENLKGTFRAFEIMDIQPPRIVVKADIVLERSVPVKPVITSPLRSGALTVDNVSVSPATVTLRGPEGVINEISSVKLPILLDPKAAGQTVNQTMPLDTPSLVTSVPSSVKVQYTITSGRAVISRRCHVMVSSNTPEDYTVEPQELQLLIEVPEALARSNGYLAKLLASVTPPALKNGESTAVQVHYRLPEGMTIVPPVIEEVTVSRRQGAEPHDMPSQVPVIPQEKIKHSK